MRVAEHVGTGCCAGHPLGTRLDVCPHNGGYEDMGTQRTHGGTEQGVLAPSYQDATRPWALIPIPQWAHGVPGALARPRAAPYSPRDLSCCARAPRCQAAAPHASHTRKPQGNPQGLSDVFAHRVSADGRNFHIGSDIWLRETRSSLISLCVFPYCTKPAPSVAPGSAVPRPSAALLRLGLSAGMSEPWGL